MIDFKINKQYRFKTETELISEYGLYWRDICNQPISLWYENMDFFLGNYIHNFYIHEQIHNIIYISETYGEFRYTVSINVIKIKNPPNYKPKQLIYIQF